MRAKRGRGDRAWTTWRGAGEERRREIWLLMGAQAASLARPCMLMALHAPVTPCTSAPFLLPGPSGLQAEVLSCRWPCKRATRATHATTCNLRPVPRAVCTHHMSPPAVQSSLLPSLSSHCLPAVHVRSISYGGPAKVRGTGSRRIPHRLNAEERVRFDAAKRKVRVGDHPPAAQCSKSEPPTVW